MEILIYVTKVTPRIHYTFNHICSRLLGFNVVFTTNKEDFIAHKDIKFSYADKQLGSELFIQSHGLLHEQGIYDIDINMSTWDNIPCFFKTSTNSDIPFDIFSASFYLISRYEEYLPHVKNNIGDYPAIESLAYKNNFLTKPIIDIWFIKFKKILQEKYRSVEFKPQKGKVKLIIAVEKAFKYRKLGLLRSIKGIILDLFRVKFKEIYNRIKIQFNPDEDPYDVYNELVNFKNKASVEMAFMFQLGDWSVHTKNINYHKPIYKRLIKSMGDYCEIGLLPSYEALKEPRILIKEIKRFEDIANHELRSILVKDKTLNYPEYYANLDKTNIKIDYSMGYFDTIGFRASTCSPFLFYDLNLEQASPIVIQPYFLSTLGLKHLKKEIMHQYILENKNICIPYHILFYNHDFQDIKLKNKIYELTEMIQDVQQ